MLKFFHEDFDLQEVFPPLAGVRGWILGNFVLIHPPTPASGGENPCKPPNFVQKINALKFAKKNLTALPFEGGWGDVTPIISRIIGIDIEKHPPNPLQKGELRRANQNLRNKL